jgi:hypothetical protein
LISVSFFPVARPRFSAAIVNDAFRRELLRVLNRGEVLEYMHRHPIAAAWGRSDLASSDMMSLEATDLLRAATRSTRRMASWVVASASSLTTPSIAAPAWRSAAQRRPAHCHPRAGESASRVAPTLS